MPPRWGRPMGGDHRIDKAIDHFGLMGYAARDVRAVINDLLKLYGRSEDAWKLLEEGPYQVVQDRLFEIEEEEKQKQEQQLLLEHHQQQDDQQVEDEPPQHQEPAADKGVEDPIEPQDTISISNNKVPAQTKSADEEVEVPMLIAPPVREAVLPLNTVTRTGPRRPCYGWLSESEDEED